MVFSAGMDSLFVGVPGFEPGTPWSQTRCASRAALHPEKYYFMNRTLTLFNLYQFPFPTFQTRAERGGFEPPVQFPVRQFSKLLVSATHPPLQIFGWCKCRNHFHLGKIISIKNPINIDFLNIFSQFTHIQSFPTVILTNLKNILFLLHTSQNKINLVLYL